MFSIVVIAASAGGLAPLRQIVAGLREGCAASIFVVMHTGASYSHLPEILNYSSAVTAAFAQDGEPIEPGHIYVAPADRHVLLQPGRMRLDAGPKVHFARPAADSLFVSAAQVYGNRVLGIVLSGGDSDGATGLRVIKENGGVSLVQRPETAAHPSMPRTAMQDDHPEACSVAEIAERVRSLC